MVSLNIALSSHPEMAADQGSPVSQRLVLSILDWWRGRVVREAYDKLPDRLLDDIGLAKVECHAFVRDAGRASPPIIERVNCYREKTP